MDTTLFFYLGAGGDVPDPLRSSTGSVGGSPQQQVSTGGVQRPGPHGRGSQLTPGVDRGDQPPNGYPSGRLTDPSSGGVRPLQPQGI